MLFILGKMILVESLKDRLSELEEENKQLKMDCQQLDKENDQQAANYVKICKGSKYIV